MQAAKAMKAQLGWDVVNVAGGTEAWAAEGRPLATATTAAPWRPGRLRR